MNLNAIVNSAIATINPNQVVSVQVSIGSTTNPDGSRGPAFAPAISAIAQVQPLEYTDITLLDSLNIQGVRQKMWLNGELDGLVRQTSQGGDLITTPDGKIWKVAVASEQWQTSAAAPVWVSVLVTLQNASS